MMVLENGASPASGMREISKSMVALHKSQFGRGPTRSRSHFAGADTLVCVLEEVLLPAELKLVELGEASRVRESRTAFQTATRDDFVGVAEGIVGRRARAFASAVDPHANVVWEIFTFETAEGARAGSDRDESDRGES